MAITFDPINKLIRLTSPTTSVTAQDLYTSAMDWAEELDNLHIDVPMDANGKFPLGGGVFSDIIYRLLSDWKLKWFDGDKSVFVSGTLITDDNTVRTVPADTGNVETVFQVNTYGTIEQTDVSVNGFVNDASIDGTEFNGNISLSAVDDFYNGSVLVFTTGALKGIARKVSDYIGANRTFRFLGGSGAADSAFPISPTDQDKFRIIGRMV
jgi:hypothetical protein